MSRSSTPKRIGGSGGTPATVALERAGVQFRVHAFDHDVVPGELGYGKAAAAALGVDEQRVFKTLLVEAHGPTPHAVAIVPVSGQLSVKSMAAAIGAKRVDMLDPRRAERLTGYVVGGISPFGQKKLLATVIDESALLHPTIFVSGGKRGLDIEISPRSLIDVLDATIAVIAT